MGHHGSSSNSFLKIPSKILARGRLGELYCLDESGFKHNQRHLCRD